MAHHIFFIKIINADAGYVLQHFGRMDQPAFPSDGKINLCNVAGYHHVGPEPEAGQNHFHLLRRGVLRFIQNDERTVQGTPPHVRQRRHFNGTPFQIFLRCIAAQHIKQRIIQRTQVRIHLFLQIPRQEAQLFPGLHGRTGQDDPLHFPFLQRCNRHGHSQIRLARAGGTDAECDEIIFDGADIIPLPQRFGLNLMAPPGDDQRFRIHIVQLGHRATLHHINAITHIMAGNRKPLPVQEQQFLKQLFQFLIFLFTATENNLVAPGHDRRVKAGVDQPQKFIIPPQDADHLLLVVDFNYMFVR